MRTTKLSSPSTIPKRLNVRDLLLTLSRFVVLILLVVTGNNILFAQSNSPCYDNPPCSAGDIVISDVFLARDLEGTPVMTSDCDSPPAMAYLCIQFTNGTNSGRDGIYFSGTIQSGSTIADVTYCFDDFLPPMKDTTLCAPNPVFIWECDEEVNLYDAHILWPASGGEVCPGNVLDCDAAKPAKCFDSVIDTFVVNVPLVVGFDFSKQCLAGEGFETVTFNSTTIGGTEPYVTYLWDFGDGNTDNSNPTSHTYNSTDSFLVTLTVTDSDGDSDSDSETITIESCCSLDVTCPSDFSIACDQVPTNIFSYGEGVVNDHCGQITVDYNFIHPGSCGGNVNLDITIIDDNGTSDSSDDVEVVCSIDITVLSASAAIFTNLPGNITIDCGAAPPTETDLDYDNEEGSSCANAGTITSTIMGSHDQCGGTYTETWSGTDDCGNALSHSRTITVSPSSAAIFTNLPGNITIDCGAAPPSPTDLDYDNEEGSSCANAGTITSTIMGSHDQCGGTYTETWSGTDDCDNSLSHSRTITVNPSSAASFVSLPGNTTIDCGAAPPSPTDLDYDNEEGSSCANAGTITSTIMGSHDQCGGTYTETWSGTDDCGNALSHSRTITVNPSSAASFVSLPGNTTIDCGAAPPSPTDLDYDNEEGSSCANAGTITSTIMGSHDQCGGTYTETWSGTDDCGNALSHSRTITVSPSSAAIFTNLPGNITIDCGAAPPSPTDLDYDNEEGSSCANAGTITSTIMGSHDQCGGTYTETWSGTDDCGNALSHSRTITVSPSSAAIFTNLPGNITIDCGAAPPSPTDLDYDNEEGSSCANAGTITSTIMGSHDQCGGTYTETWSGTDDCGNALSHSRTITVNPSSAASFVSLPGNTTIDCGAAPPSPTDLDYDNEEGSSCANAGTITSTIMGSHDQQCGGTYTETWSGTDDCGNALSHSRTITVSPSSAAIFTNLPGNITIDCGAAPPSPTDLDYDNEEGSSCANAGTITSTIMGSHDQCGGTYTETWSGTDDCGNALSHSRTITVNPSSAASFVSLPGNTTIDCGAAPPSPTDLDYDNEEGSSCANAGTITSTIMGSHDQCGGTYTETWSGTDDCGNALSHSRTITVSPSSAAIFTNLPGNITIDCGAAPPSPTDLDYDNEEGSSCANAGTITSTIMGSHDQCGGTYTETWSGTDDCGNALSHSRTITVSPSSAASFVSLPGNTTIDCGAAPPSPTDLDYDNEEGSSCANAGTITSTIMGSHDQCGGTYTETWSGTDDCDNSLSHSRTITVNPASAPVYTTLPSAITIDCSLAPPSSTFLDYTNNESGACLIEGSVESVITGEYNPCGGIYVETWSTTDICGNVLYHSRNITITDTTDPVIEIPANDMIVECDGSGNIMELQDWLATIGGGAMASDDCSEVTWTNDFTELSDGCGMTGTVTVTFTVSDLCGNISETAATFTIIDTTDPEIEFSNPMLLGLENGDTLFVQCYGMDPDWDLPQGGENDVSVFDQCGLVIVDFSEELLSIGNCKEDGYIRRYKCLWTAVDECGNESELFIYMELIDQISPVLHNVPDDITIDCGESYGREYVFATDECQCAEVEYTESELPNECLDGREVIRKWVATDCCGNTSEATQVITLVDDTPAELSFNHPELLEVENGYELFYECHYEGYPTFFDELDETSIIADDACLGEIFITFSVEDISPATNCEHAGFLEKRTFSWLVIDACGNSSSIQFTAILEDNTPPEFIGYEESICVKNLEDAHGVYGLDYCSQGRTTYSDEIKEMECGDGEYVLRTWMAYDGCGNYATIDQTIYFHSDFTLEFLTDNPLLQDLESGDTVVISSSQIEDIPSMSGFLLDDIYVSEGCLVTGEMTISEEMIGEGLCIDGVPYNYYLVTWSVGTKCGDQSFEIFVGVYDESSMSLVDFEEFMTLSCGDDIPELLIEGNIEFIDIVIESIEQSSNDQCDNISTIIRNIRVFNACGDTLNFEQKITFIDDVPPIISGVDEFICADDSLPNVLAYDECSQETVEVSMVEDTLDECEHGLVLLRTWSAQDRCGNITTIEQKISLNDTVAPEMLIQDGWIYHFINNNVVNLSDDDVVAGMEGLFLLSIYGQDKCDYFIAPEYENEVSFSNDCEADGYFAIEHFGWSFADECGNTSSLVLNLEVIDDVAPVILNPPADITLYCTGLPQNEDLEIFDHSEFDITIKDASDERNVFTRTYTVTDACGNITVYVQVITIDNADDLICKIEPEEKTILCNSHENILYGQATGGTGPYTYHWEVEGVCFIQGGQGTDQLLLYVGFNEITVYLTITDANGCVTHCSFTIDCFDKKPFGRTFNKETDIESRSTVDNSPQSNIVYISASPNPTRSYASVYIISNTEGTARLQIFDMLGKEVYGNSEDLVSGVNEIELDLSNLLAGQYVVRLSDKGERHVLSLVKLD